MSSPLLSSTSADVLCRRLYESLALAFRARKKRWLGLFVALWIALFSVNTLHATILWSDLGATLVHDTGIGTDILGGALRRDDSSSGTLYFKFHIDPLSDGRTEEYLAAFQLMEGKTERLGVGNSLKAWAYSAFNTSEKGENNNVFGDLDLHSSNPESAGLGTLYTYELPRRGTECTIVFKVQYIPDGDDLVTAWLNPDLGPGATEASQSTNLTTTFYADASFDEIHLRHEGGGGGWTFSDMAIATSFNDFVAQGGMQSGTATTQVGRRPFTLTFQSWQRDQGLPQNTIHALAQTREGYLWVGTDDGVARFDGVRFVTLFDIRERSHNSSISILFEDSRGALWIGTSGGGLTVWSDNNLATFTTAEGLPDNSITALAEDRSGQLWVGTEAGLAVLQNGQFSTPATAEQFNGHAVSALFKDRQANIWLGVTGVGIFQFADGKFNAIEDESVEKLLQDSHCLLVDQAKRVWVGAGDDFVLCRDNGQWHRYRIPHRLAKPYVNTLVEEPDGTVWAGSASEGLFQFKAGRLLPIDASSGLLDNFVESLLVDHEGNLWVGTGSGLNLLRRSNLSVVGQKDGLGYGAVQGLAEISPGIIWAGKPGEGVYRWQGRSFNRLNAPDLSADYLQINSLLTTRDGSCWVATTRGLLQFKKPGAEEVEAQKFLDGWNVISLCEDRDAGLWAGTREGQLWRMFHDAWIQQTNFAQNEAITAIAQDKEGAIWLGTAGDGVCRFRNGARSRFGKGSGLLSSVIRTIYADDSGALWIGTAGGGLSRWSGDVMKTFTKNEGLPDNTVSQILEDGYDRLWLGTDRGIASIRKHDLDELAAQRIPSVYPRIYGRSDGMLSEECTGGGYPAGLKAASGLLWFPTLKGIAVVDPRPVNSGAPSPTVLLEEVLVDGTSVSTFSQESVRTNGTLNSADPDKKLRLSPGQHRIEFRYTALNFSAPEKMNFRYQLEGLDKDWVEARTERTARYNYLPPGDYRFRVVACNSDGVWESTGANIAFTVAPFFWQTWWFIGIGSFAVLACVGGGIRFMEKRKLQRRLKHLEQERALARERARISQDLHDDLGSSLARISLLSGLLQSDKDNPVLVETHAAKISNSADQTVRALEEIVWAVRPGSDSLQSLVEYIAHFASEMFEGDGPRCRLDLPHDLPPRSLPPEIRHNIFLVVKEALTNTLKHASAKEVFVQAKAPDHLLEILVRDDGKGFDTAMPAVEGRRNGLNNMRRRAEAIGGVLAVKSSPGQGTTIWLSVDFSKKPGDET